MPLWQGGIDNFGINIMEIIEFGFKVGLRSPKDETGSSTILQVCFQGRLEHEGVKYNFYCSCVPVVTVLNIGYYINQLNNLMEKGHTHISTIENGKYKRADKNVYEVAKVDLYPRLLEECQRYFPDLNSVNVSE